MHRIFQKKILHFLVSLRLFNLLFIYPAFRKQKIIRKNYQFIKYNKLLKIKPFISHLVCICGLFKLLVWFHLNNNHQPQRDS